MHYTLKNIGIELFLGVYTSEKGRKQKIKASLSFDFDATKAAVSDKLKDTIDYAAIESFIKKFPGEKHFDLLEYLHAEICRALKHEIPEIQNIVLSLEKFPFEKGSIIISNR